MLQLIGLFFPALLSLAVYEGLDGNKKNEKKRELWSYLNLYGAFTLLDVVTASVIEKSIKSSNSFAVNGDFTDEFLSVSYLFLVIIAAIFWGYCIRIFKNFFQIQVQEDNIDADEETKNMNGVDN